MKPILGKVLSFSASRSGLTSLTVDAIRSDEGHEITKYSELISKLAQLAFENPELVLLLRGQSSDHRERPPINPRSKLKPVRPKATPQTTLFPTMYRNPANGDNMYGFELRRRYHSLRECESQLYRVLQGTHYWDRVGRSELARWAILQHYEVCPTPLLDVTHSALVACSFGCLNQGSEKHFYLYVIGVPQISGAITVSPNQGLQVVRLSSVCPPETLRPYFQEGYLIGTYPSVDTLDEKMRYKRSEMDCAQRLVAKFKIQKTQSFWDRGFHRLPETALYPDEQSGLCSEIAKLKKSR